MWRTSRLSLIRYNQKMAIRIKKWMSLRFRLKNNQQRAKIKAEEKRNSKRIMRNK